MAVLVCVGVCIGLNNFDKAHYMTSDYKYYADYQPIRALFVDGDFYDREAIYDELEERGLHDLSFAAFSSWMFYDTDLYTLQKIKPLEKVVLHNIYQVNWAKMPIAIMKALSSGFMNTIAWCWVLFSLLLLFLPANQAHCLHMPWDNSVNKNAVINAVVSTHLVKNMPLNNA